jgi:two-component sensor histidine kinase
LTVHSENAEIRANLLEISSQIMSVGNIHELLQSSPDLNKVDLSRLLSALCENLAHGFRAQVTFEAKGRVLIEAATATNVAIIVNELGVNALKHANSQVGVELRSTLNGIVVLVRDDGPGLPRVFDTGARAGRLGLWTAASLATRMGGKLKPLQAETGTVFELSLTREATVRLFSGNRDTVAVASASREP